MLGVDSRRADHEGQGAVAVPVLVPHGPLLAVTVLAIRVDLGSLIPPLPFQSQKGDQEGKLLSAPQSTITSLRAVTAIPRDIFDPNVQNL